MALPLNVYKTEFSTSLDPVSRTTLYTAGTGYNAVILSVVACNTSSTVKTVEIELNRNGGRVNLVKDFSIPGNDAAELTTGRIIVQQGDLVEARASDNTVHVVISLLETKI